MANIRGERHYLWMSVDQEGAVVESFVTKKRDKAAALKFLKKAMKRYGNPHVAVPKTGDGATFSSPSTCSSANNGDWVALDRHHRSTLSSPGAKFAESDAI